jgi:hypothetical protein
LGNWLAYGHQLASYFDPGWGVDTFFLYDQCRRNKNRRYWICTYSGK